METLLAGSMTGMAAAIRRGDVTAREVVAAHLRRLEEDHTNAVITIAARSATAEADRRDAEAAAGRWRGPLHGVPFTVKDVIDTAEITTTWGSAGARDRVPARDASVVARLRAAGGIVLAKSNTPEFAAAAVTDNAIVGLTRNPYDPERTPGGSSGGGAALVATGASPLDIGSDAAGSIRLPAHYCGVAALKPTPGVLPATGTLDPALGLGMTVVGFLARRVGDLTTALRLCAGPDGVDGRAVPVAAADPDTVVVSRLRVAVHTEDGSGTPSPEVRAAVAVAADSLAAAGAVVVETAPPGLVRALDAYFAHSALTAAYRLRRLLDMAGTRQPSRIVRARLQAAPPPGTLTDYLDAVAEMEAARAEMRRVFASCDAVLCPVAADVAPRHADAEGRRHGYLTPYSLAGWPAVVVPVTLSAAGLPVAVQVLAPPFAEPTALALAAVIETVAGPLPAPPPSPGEPRTQARGG